MVSRNALPFKRPDDQSFECVRRTVALETRTAWARSMRFIELQVGHRFLRHLLATRQLAPAEKCICASQFRVESVPAVGTFPDDNHLQ